MRTLLSGILCMLAFTSQAQRIENFRTEVKGRIIEITYDLISEEDGITFDLNLYSSLDNYTAPLKFVSGDVGEEILPGIGKKITWNAGQELQEFQGDVFLELRGIITPPWIRILTPNRGDKVKPGKELEIRWDSDVDRDIKIDLYRGTSFVSEITSTPNSGSYIWLVPASAVKDSKYNLVFTSPAKRGKQESSGYFTISKGVPIWAVGGGVVVVGVVVAILTMGEDPPDDDETTTDEINDPPKPGGN